MSALPYSERWDSSAVDAVEEANEDFGPGGVLKAPTTLEEAERLKAKYPGEFIPLTHLLVGGERKEKCRTCERTFPVSQMNVKHGNDWYCNDVRGCLHRAGTRDGDQWAPSETNGPSYSQHSYQQRIAREDEAAARARDARPAKRGAK